MVSMSTTREIRLFSILCSLKDSVLWGGKGGSKNHWKKKRDWEEIKVIYILLTEQQYLTGGKREKILKVIDEKYLPKKKGNEKKFR